MVPRGPKGAQDGMSEKEPEDWRPFGRLNSADITVVMALIAGWQIACQQDVEVGVR